VEINKHIFSYFLRTLILIGTFFLGGTKISANLSKILAIIINILNTPFYKTLSKCDINCLAIYIVPINRKTFAVMIIVRKTSFITLFTLVIELTPY
jgi:type III secretory pathway component EscU